MGRHNVAVPSGAFGCSAALRWRPPVWHCGGMLRTADDVIEALRSRKTALGVSNATIDELSGFASGYFDKVAGPSRIKSPSLYALMAIAGALGLAVQLVEDPDTKMQHRWTPRRARRVRQSARVSKAVLHRARPHVLSEFARHANRVRWDRTTPEARAAVVAALNTARKVKQKQRRRRTKTAA